MVSGYLFSWLVRYSTIVLSVGSVCAYSAERRLTGERQESVVMDAQVRTTTTTTSVRSGAAPADAKPDCQLSLMQRAVAAARESLPQMGIGVGHAKKTPQQEAAFRIFVDSLLLARVDSSDVDMLLAKGKQGDKRIVEFLDRLDRFFERRSRGLEPQRPRPPVNRLKISQPDYVETPADQPAQPPHICLIQAPPAENLDQIRAVHKDEEIASLRYKVFNSGVRICGLEIKPDYLGRGVAHALIRRLEKAVRYEHCSESGLDVALVTASVELKREALPLLMTLKRVGFQVVGYSSRSERLDLRWELKDTSPGDELKAPRRLQLPASTTQTQACDIVEACQEGEQLGFFTPVQLQTELSDRSALTRRNISVIRASSVVGTAGYMVVEYKALALGRETNPQNYTATILQMGFHPLLKSDEVIEVGRCLLRRVKGNSNLAKLFIPHSAIAQPHPGRHTQFFAALGFVPDTNDAGVQGLILDCEKLDQSYRPRKPR